MAGSFDHCDTPGGTFSFGSILNMGDARQAAEEMHWLVRYLAVNDDAVIKAAVDHLGEIKRGERVKEVWQRPTSRTSAEIVDECLEIVARLSHGQSAGTAFMQDVQDRLDHLKTEIEEAEAALP